MKFSKEVLGPLYGPQEDALNKIALGKDRTCFLLYETDPVGVIAFKTVLSDEFAEYKIHQSIEIKSLFVTDPEKNSRRGFGPMLLQKVIDEVKKLPLKPESFHVTVSASRADSLNFFMGRGFRIKHQWMGKYKPNMFEYLLSCPAQTLFLSPQAQIKTVEPTMTSHPHALFVVNDVHWGDIHVLQKLSDGTFITGSKDNSLSKWNEKGKRVRVVSEVEPSESDEKDWITAACVINEEYWVSGERNGRVTLWSTSGEYIKSLKPKMPKSAHVSHENNKYRVNCLSSGINPQKPGFFIGFPTLFDEFNLIEGRTKSSTFVHKNDWVYCIHPLSKDRILSVTAGKLEVRDRSSKGWRRGALLLKESDKVNNQRPFISCLKPLPSSPNHFGLAVFGGSVKIYDLQAQKVVQQWKEHKDRIWALESVSPQLFATGGEDRSIKFWDIRNPKSVRSLNDHIGQVTTLMKLSENLIVAGTCPDQPDQKARTNQGAQLLFYEMRK